MTDVDNELSPVEPLTPSDGGSDDSINLSFFKIRFRNLGQEFTASSLEHDLRHGTVVMVQTDHGSEPAMLGGRTASLQQPGCERMASFRILRAADQQEQMQYGQLPQLEQEAFDLCSGHIEQLHLPMHLVRVERFFNGTKIIFYFTAESRVDFRELVKALVQDFHVRVEMRQIGVRHETQMIGGLGACGRELCCSSFLNKFDSVSIKMAKAQDLPLNPTKISGLCNRLLCCLTYEYDTYKVMKKGMPRVGRHILFEGKTYMVTRQIPLLGKVAATCEGEERLFAEAEWRGAELVPKAPNNKGPGKKGAGKSEKPAMPAPQEENTDE